MNHTHTHTHIYKYKYIFIYTHYLGLKRKESPNTPPLATKIQANTNSDRSSKPHVNTTSAAPKETNRLAGFLPEGALFAKAASHPLFNPPASKSTPAEYVNLGVLVAKGRDNDFLEDYSGLTVKNRTISSTEFKNNMAGKTHVKLEHVKQRTADGAVDGGWVTIGVLTSKTHPTQSKNGGTYVRWVPCEPRILISWLTPDIDALTTPGY